MDQVTQLVNWAYEEIDLGNTRKVERMIVVMNRMIARKALFIGNIRNRLVMWK